MTKLKCEELQETSLSGVRGSSVTIRVGEKICWINPAILRTEQEKRLAKQMIEDYGNSPFKLKQIIREPAGRIMLVFDDKNGQEQKINSCCFTDWPDEEESTEQSALLPFHESIIKAIERASSLELPGLAALIIGTEIPKGHDEVYAAWVLKIKQSERKWDLGVPANLLEQKEKATKKKEEADQKLQEVCRKLSVLVRKEMEGHGHYKVRAGWKDGQKDSIVIGTEKLEGYLTIVGNYLKGSFEGFPVVFCDLKELEGM